MQGQRPLVVVADDFGIGPATTRGILDVAREGRVTAAVLLVNSPYAEEAVAAWMRAGRSCELGWHPCLTLDRPLLPPDAVPSLVDPSGGFCPLGRFLRRAVFGQIRAEHVAAEFRAQYQRFRDLVGRPPTVVNSHQHVALFGPVGTVLLDVLADQTPRPFVRRIGEPLGQIVAIPGAWLKRFELARRGRQLARQSARLGFPGCDVLIGVTNPPCVADERYLERWLDAARGDRVELMCHPGYRDETLVGRDCRRDDAYVKRRTHELELLRLVTFPAAVARGGFRLTAPSEISAAARLDA
jgi:chitin disaccharide deacetylase